MNRLHALALVVVLFVVGCSASQRQVERQALTWSQTLCLMTKDAAAAEPAWLALACDIDLALVPLIEQFLTTYRARLAEERARALAGPTCPQQPPGHPQVPPSAPKPTTPPPSASARLPGAPMTALFRTGYIPDPEGHLRTPWRGAAHGSGSVPTAASLELEADVALQGHFDQGDTGSCTGHALAGCIATAFRAAGKPLPFVPSPAGIYTMARAVDRYDVHEPLEDIGAMPNQAVRGVQEWGVRPMHALPGRWSDAEAATINREPQLEDIAEALKTLIVGARAIRTTGSARALDVKRALSTGLPIAAAINGGCDAFQGYSSGILTADDLRGQRDHYVWLFGYDRDTYFIWNSWGASWGIGGNAVLAVSALDLLGDLYVILPDRA